MNYPCGSSLVGPHPVDAKVGRRARNGKAYNLGRASRRDQSVVGTSGMVIIFHRIGPNPVGAVYECAERRGRADQYGHMANYG
jgi:hypothetical protein